MSKKNIISHILNSSTLERVTVVVSFLYCVGVVILILFNSIYVGDFDFDFVRVKPLSLVSVVCAVFAVVAVVLFFVCEGKLKTAYDASGLADSYEAKKSFGIYYATCIALIVNAVVAFVHMIMSFVNTSIWKKTGKVK